MRDDEQQEAEKQDWKEWHDAQLKTVGPELLAIAGTAVDRELESRRELNARLSATIAFAGLLLAAAFGFGNQVGRLELSTVFDVLTSGCFVLAVSALVLAVALALYALLPDPRNGPNPALLRFHAVEGSKDEEIRKDVFKLEVSVLRQLEPGNTQRAAALLRSQRIVGMALTVAAVGALILFFSDGRASDQQNAGQPFEREHATPPAERRSEIQSEQAQNLGDESSRGSGRRQQGRLSER